MKIEKLLAVFYIILALSLGFNTVTFIQHRSLVNDLTKREILESDTNFGFKYYQWRDMVSDMNDTLYETKYSMRDRLEALEDYLGIEVDDREIRYQKKTKSKNDNKSSNNTFGILEGSEYFPELR